MLATLARSGKRDWLSMAGMGESSGAGRALAAGGQRPGDEAGGGEAGDAV
jgi:hypothetical protein